MQSVEKSPNSGPGLRFARTFAFAAAAATLALTAGCASLKRDHVIVGSVPDDYRTNHPVSLADREVTLDLPADSGGMTRGEQDTLAGFMARYDRASGGVVRIMSPAGAANDAAAMRKVTAVAAALQRLGVNSAAIQTVPYGVTSATANAPVRVAYTVLTADTNACGRWPGDLADTTDNKHYANFGCSYQKNLAAQIDNPSDLLGPRGRSEIDPERRGKAIDDWQQQKLPWENTIFY